MRGVNLELLVPGEVLGLAGDNGAGNPLLTKVPLARWDPLQRHGSYDGEQQQFTNPADPLRC